MEAGGKDVDLIETWALKIAEEATPEEVDLAPIMAKAFVAGGREKVEMFRRSGGAVHGAFGAEVAAAVFPFILQGIVLAWGPLQWLLTSNVMSNLGAINDLLGIKDRLQRKRHEESLPDTTFASLKQVNAIVSEELRAAGLRPERCELITYRVLKRMLEDPTGAAEFSKEIAEAAR